MTGLLVLAGLVMGYAGAQLSRSHGRHRACWAVVAVVAFCLWVTPMVIGMWRLIQTL